jgi:hypothetical protein
MILLALVLTHDKYTMPPLKKVVAIKVQKLKRKK